MQLTILTDTDAEKLSRKYLIGVGAVKMYFCSTGRNAWHGMINRYGPVRCMHNTLTGAQQFAENQRVQGSVFYIEELPTLLLIEQDFFCVLVTQINTKHPLKDY